MTLRTATLGLAIAALGTTAFAFDLGGLKTRVLYGLEGPSQARDISNKVLGNTVLGAEGIESLAGRNLRTRFWTINDQGIVPIHDHANRPAVFTVLSGEIFEYTSTAEERVLHEAGGLALEEGELAHWWLNEGDETVHLIAFDVFAPNNADTAVASVPAGTDFELRGNQGVSDELLGVVNLSNHFSDGTGDGWVLSTYRATIAPGGTFASFVEAGEPLQSFVWEGEVIEHGVDNRTTLATHEGSTVAGGAKVWWENTGDVPAVMYFGVVEPEAEVAGVPRTAPLAHGSHGE
ncbi:cupin domain-containing protein [uncultured Tateyamaria sp.]|uniref:cupin domain-containing protein n=1 Tax=uncultured Tateyamaria sp. TaxID=455651 RepID=UPI00260DB941|nr:cupin domain-containing protein [uncultured Tateyamaria sp.]